MIRSIAVGAALAAAVAGLPAVRAQEATPGPAAPQAAPAAADAALAAQARHWEDKGRYDLARESWLKLLRIAPDNPTALTGLAMAEARSGRAAAAQVYLDRLRQVQPDTPAIRQIEDAIRSGSFDQSRLEGPRTLARQGKFDEAIAGYREIFGTEIPDGRLGLEYYQTLAGTTDGWEAARAGIAKLAAAHADEPVYALALAQHLTYREETRREGIAGLGTLARGKTGVAAPATQAWRQALLWLGAKPADEKLYREFLADRQDAQVAAKLETLRAGTAAAATGGYPRADAVREPTAEEVRGQQVKAAFDKLNEGELADADSQFQDLLARYPDNEDVLGGLGIVRLRQERYAEAHAYLQQASTRAPKKAARWSEALSSARFWERVRAAGVAREAGNADQAETLLRSAIAGDPALAAKEPSVKSSLADLLVESEDLDGAEALYREILAQRAGDTGATRGLVGVLVKRGQIGEALTLASTLSPQQREELGNLGALKGQYLRDQAKLATDAGDDAQAEQLLKQALLEDPESPWTRLDLSRIYQRQKRTHEANTLIDGLLTGGRQMAEALQIKALLLAEQDAWLEGLQTLEQIPYEKRTQAMADLQRRLWVRYQTARASVFSRYGRVQEANAILQQVEPYAGDSPELLGALATALADTGQDGRALNYIRQALSRQSSPDIGTRLQYASLLFKLHQDAEFEVVMEDLLTHPNWTEQQSLDLASLRIAYRLRQADLVREQGNLARAYEYLDPLLKVNPNDPRLLMALARLYTDAKEHERAAGLYARVLQTDPENLDAYKGAIGAALSLDQVEQAQELLDHAIMLDPQNPRLYALAARAARARGEDGRALQLYQQALKLDQERGGESEFGDGRYTPKLYLLDPTTTPVNLPSYGRVSRAEPAAGPAVPATAGRHRLPASGPTAVAVPTRAPVSAAAAMSAADRQPAQRTPAAGRLVAVRHPAARPASAPALAPRAARAPSAPAPARARRPLARGDAALVVLPRWWQQGRLIKVSTEPERPAANAPRYPAPAAVPVPAASGPGWVQTAPDRYSYSLQMPGSSLVTSPYATAPAPSSVPAQAPAATVPAAGLPRYTPRQLVPSPQLSTPRARPRESFRDEMVRNMGEISGDRGAVTPTAPPALAPIPASPGYLPAQVGGQVYPRPAAPIPAGAPRYPAAAARAQAPLPAASLPYPPAPPAPVAPDASLHLYPAPPGVGATEAEYRRQGLRVLPGPAAPVYVPAPVVTVPVAPAYGSVVPAPLPAAPAPALGPVYPTAQPVPYGLNLAPAGDPAAANPDLVLQRRRVTADQPNEVLREIADINARRTAWAGFGLAMRNRDGQSGLDRLRDLETPIEFSVAGVNAGRFKLRAVPVSLEAGTVAGAQLPLFGALGVVTDVIENPEAYSFSQSETGVAVGAAYEVADFKADFGSSPLGFPVETLVGGINWQPKLGAVSFKLDLSRRSVTDSLLSYAGAYDPATGENWGGVTKTGGRLDLAFDLGAYGLYANGSYHVLDGENVAQNNVYELGGGFYARALDRRDMRVTWGVNVTTFFYDKNLRRFTFGQGGYFSPQNYLSVAVPVEWSGGRGRFSYRFNAAIGIQSFKEDGTAAFPNNTELQTRAETLLIDYPDGNVVAGFPGQSSTGIGFNFMGNFEYLIAPNLAAGSRFGIDNARDYKEAQAIGYVRYYFAGQRSASRPPNTLLPYYEFGDPTL